jgi:hypothetical protein
LAHCAGYAHAWARLIIGQDVKSGEDRDIPEGRGLKMKAMRIPPPVPFFLLPYPRVQCVSPHWRLNRIQHCSG